MASEDDAASAADGFWRGALFRRNVTDTERSDGVNDLTEERGGLDRGGLDIEPNGLE